MIAVVAIFARAFGRPVQLRDIPCIAQTHRAEQSARKRNDTRGIGRAIRERREYVLGALKAAKAARAVQ